MYRNMNKKVLIIRTEERPKKTTIATILNTGYSTDLVGTDIEIVPYAILKNSSVTHDGIFYFSYEVKINSNVIQFNKIVIEIVSGSSSFIDYLIFEKDNTGNEYLVAMIEETKTDDTESRNAVYQRASKFIYANLFYPEVPKYMLYIDEPQDKKKPSDTAIFGTKLLKTIGVKILGKNDFYKNLTPFFSVDEIINFKNNMRRPCPTNTPILITKLENGYVISGTLSKPQRKGNIEHDPNIGALTLIAAAIRVFDNDSPIWITEHKVSQNYIDRVNGNKFLFIASALRIILDTLNYNYLNYYLKEDYWHLEVSSEKVTTIFLHILLEGYGANLIYENHAGCERGYFYAKNKEAIQVCKSVAIPDLIMEIYPGRVLLIEGKKIERLSNGLKELENYDKFENEYINLHYPGAIVERWVTTFGGNLDTLPHPKVLIHINNDGRIFISEIFRTHLEELKRKAFI